MPVCLLQILAYVNKVREVGCSVDNASFTLEQVEATPVRCPDPEAAERMYQGARSCNRPQQMVLSGQGNQPVGLNCRSSVSSS